MYQWQKWKIWTRSLCWPSFLYEPFLNALTMKQVTTLESDDVQLIIVVHQGLWQLAKKFLTDCTHDTHLESSSFLTSCNYDTENNQRHINLVCFVRNVKINLIVILNYIRISDTQFSLNLWYPVPEDLDYRLPRMLGMFGWVKNVLSASSGSRFGLGLHTSGS